MYEEKVPCKILSLKIQTVSSYYLITLVGPIMQRFYDNLNFVQRR